MSQLQQTYPLSPRKFWKKMIGNFFRTFFIVLILGIGIQITQLSFGFATHLSLLSPWFLGSMFILYLAVLILFAWYVQTYIRVYYYDMSENFITIKKGVFAPQEIHVQFAKIQDVYVDQDIVDRVMGLYDVHLASATASSAMEAHIDGVEYEAAEGLKNLLLKMIQEGGNRGSTIEIPQAQPKEELIKFSEDVSSRTYPLIGKWVFISTIVNFFTTFFYTIVLLIWLSAQFDDPRYFLGSVFGYPTLLVAGLIFGVIFLFRLIYLLIWKNVYHFEFLPEYVLMRTGVISRNEIHIPYRTVQDVNITQNITERMFGLATVVIENASAGRTVGRQVIKSNVTVPGQPLEKAKHLGEVIRKVLLAKNSSQTGI